MQQRIAHSVKVRSKAGIEDALYNSLLKLSPVWVWAGWAQEELRERELEPEDPPTSNLEPFLLQLGRCASGELVGLETSVGHDPQELEDQHLES